MVYQGGDDCIALKPNSTDITIRNVTCVGGTGIAFGSIAQYEGVVCRSSLTAALYFMGRVADEYRPTSSRMWSWRISSFTHLTSAPATRVFTSSRGLGELHALIKAKAREG